MFQHLLEKIATTFNKAKVPYRIMRGQAVLL